MKPDSADLALQSYLDALLQPEPTEPAPAPRPFAEPPRRLRALPPVAPPAEAAPLEAPALVADAAPAPVVEAPPAPALPVAPEPDAWAANGRPHWAQAPFDALLFSVGGLNLAVPLVELGTVSPLEPGAMTPLFGQAEWFLGLLPGKGGNIRVVDSARVVMPERYDAVLTAGYRYVITLNGSDWGLAVDNISDAVRLDPERVRWRGARGKRLWLAGTVVDHMCALLDVAQLTALFQRADRRRLGSGRRHGDA